MYAFDCISQYIQLYFRNPVWSMHLKYKGARVMEMQDHLAGPFWTLLAYGDRLPAPAVRQSKQRKESCIKQALPAAPGQPGAHVEITGPAYMQARLT